MPVLHLRVRRAATALGATLVVVHPRATGLDPDADHVVRYRPGDGFGLLERLSSGSGDLASVAAALAAAGTGAIAVAAYRQIGYDNRQLSKADFRKIYSFKK